ncbi:hypothetical protein HanIR_Chr04g0176961 [Helianthus annuus]|nr:hypothetical protein HanIR_Chr04g0176961 [Helianthus annuus]
MEASMLTSISFSFQIIHSNNSQSSTYNLYLPNLSKSSINYKLMNLKIYKNL